MAGTAPCSVSGVGPLSVAIGAWAANAETATVVSAMAIAYLIMTRLTPPRS